MDYNYTQGGAFQMNEDNFAVRLAQLRTQKGYSARDMSLSLGQSESYINKIENKRTFPSIPAFFYICDFLRITPQDFFEEGNRSSFGSLVFIPDGKWYGETHNIYREKIMQVLEQFGY